MKLKKLIKKQIKNIQEIIDQFFEKIEGIISFEEFIELRDSINYDLNEALLTWSKSGTGRWALGFEEGKKIAFGTTMTNRNYTFSKDTIDSICSKEYLLDLREIILKFNDKDMKSLLDQLTEELEEIKEIMINIKEFKKPTYTIQISKKLVKR